MAMQSEFLEAATHWMSLLSTLFACIDRQVLSKISFSPCWVGAARWRFAAPRSTSPLTPPAPSSSAPTGVTVPSVPFLFIPHEWHHLAGHTEWWGLLQEGRAEICSFLEAERDLGTSHICSCTGAGLSSPRPQSPSIAFVITDHAISI